ncbi:MAG: PDZ domain-containing protein [Microbacteriaceae bacterium]|nr:PDZ domain-containing protein [Microbacteriaceae bacterium]
MVLFDDAENGPPRRSRLVVLVGGWLVATTVFALLVFALVPSPYVIERPGPVFDTLGVVTIGGDEVPLIDIPNETTYPTSGSLDLLTVSTDGKPESLPNWFEVVTAWLDPSKAVLPLDSVYPPGYSVEQSNSDARIMMANSQKDAIAAALTELGYDLPLVVSVGALTNDSAAEGILEPGDVIVTVNGKAVTGVESMRAVIADSGTEKPMPLEILRNGIAMNVLVTPVLSDETPPAPVIGVYPSIDYTFPFEVKIQLENVGGPSGGQMFALGIIDKLTPGELNGGAEVAGTGTIDASGAVGAIGGIQQKMFGAVRAGATWFLAPRSNCAEVMGHVPSGLTVIPVSTLKDSLDALKLIDSGAVPSSLPTCSVG